MKQLFLLEDDMSLISGLSFAVKKQGYEIDVARTTLEADTLWENGKYDLAILDVSLPDGSGFDFCKKIRSTSKVPIMFLTAADEETDIIMGLDIGGDDYITKPFSLMVLRARVNVQLRNEKISEDVYKNGDFCFDFGKMEFTKGNTVLELSKTEQKLLRCFIENKGKNLSRSQLIDYIWQGDTEYVEEHALTVVVNRLRNKLGNDSECIKTVYGVGYTWARI